VTDTERLIAECRQWSLNLMDQARDEEMKVRNTLFQNTSQVYRDRAALLDRIVAELERLSGGRDDGCQTPRGS
jgi:hypothetical protein